jgi:folate-binding protein YgfZ
MSGPARWSSPAGLIRLSGPDTLRFLHGQSSQDLALAPQGACLATCLISPTARMRGLALVLVQPGGAELVLLAGDGAAIHQALDRVLFPADQVSLGPVETATLVRLIDTDPVTTTAAEGLLRPAVDLGGGRGAPLLLLRSGEALPAWAEALPELSADQAERQRLRHGLPAAPGELNDSTNPFELGLADWVSLSKGCYVGQETLAKLSTYDGVKQQLRHWRCGPAPAEACAPGSSLSTAAGERAGVISSSLAGPEGWEGLALVRRSALEASNLQSGGTLLSLSVPLGFSAPPG